MFLKVFKNLIKMIMEKCPSELAVLQGIRAEAEWLVIREVRGHSGVSQSADGGV